MNINIDFMRVMIYNILVKYFVRRYACVYKEVL